MKIVNDANLPIPLFNAIQYSERDRGDSDYTVTELIEPPRIGALKLLHKDDIVENATDRIWALIGSVGHEILRRGANGQVVEKRLFTVVEGKTISGQCDVIDDGIVDYKLTSVWAIKDGVKIEWEQQLNSYGFLAARNFLSVPELKIIAILRDWSVREAARDSNYPQRQVVVMPVRMWDTAQTELWLGSRIKIHEEARAGNLPNCLPDEMWESPERYAAVKKGNQRASKVEDTKLSIGQWVASQPKPSQYEIEIRPAERPRCQSYCPVSEKCSQFLAWKGQADVQ